MSTSIYQTPLNDKIKKWIELRGVSIKQIAELTFFLQEEHLPQLTITECENSVLQVLKKREVQNAVLTGIQIDLLAEQHKLLPPLQEIIASDEGLYGIDEILSMSILHIYGSIGLTNYGYIDKLKPGVLKQLDNSHGKEVHTFSDDLIAAIAAAAAARLAHNQFARENQ